MAVATTTMASHIYKPCPTMKAPGGASPPWLSHAIRKIWRESISTRLLHSRWSNLRSQERALRPLLRGHEGGGGGGDALACRVGGRASVSRGVPSPTSVGDRVPTSMRPMSGSLRRGRSSRSRRKPCAPRGPSPRASSTSSTTTTPTLMTTATTMSLA
jgi:hypothetical protein